MKKGLIIGLLLNKKFHLSHKNSEEAQTYMGRNSDSKNDLLCQVLHIYFVINVRHLSGGLLFPKNFLFLKPLL